MTDPGPQFLNAQWDVRRGEPFTLRFSDCAPWGCAISLYEGPEKNKAFVQKVTNKTDGNNPFTLTLAEDLPSGMYYFNIFYSREKCNGGCPSSYSPQFILDEVEKPTSKGLSPGALGGTIAGAVIALILLLIGLSFCWRKRRQKAARKASTSTTSTYVPDDVQLEMAQLREEIKRLKSENRNSDQIADLRAELEHVKKIHMLDSRLVPAEMPGSVPPAAELAIEDRKVEESQGEKAATRS